MRVSSCFSFATSFSCWSSSCAREIFAPGGERLPRLRVELDDALLELLRLKLQPLLGRDHVGDAALDVLQGLELLLVGVVQRLLRVFGAIQQRAELCPDDLSGS
jgi:hypothetical protein